MKLAISNTSLASTKIVTLSDSLRYLSIMDSYGFKPISYWRSRGMIADNICGQGSGKDGYSHVCIPCDNTFSGASSEVTVYTRVYASSPINRTFRWAITNFDLDYLFLGIGRADDSSGIILNQGTFTVDSGGVHYQTFHFPVQNLPSGRFYIYLWRDNNNYGNIHISGDFTVSVYTETGSVTWREATPYIYDGTQWKRATVYMRNRNKQWIRA